MATERTVQCPDCETERTTRANAGAWLTCGNGHRFRAPAVEAPAEPAAGGGVPVKRAATVKIRQKARPQLQDSSGGVGDKSRPGPAGPGNTAPVSPASDPVPPAAAVEPSPPPPVSSDEPPPSAPVPAPGPSLEDQDRGRRNGRKGGLGRYRELVGGRRS